MPESENLTRKSNLTDKEWEIIKSIRDSGVINFDQLGKLVSKVGPALFDPDVAADDYVVKGYDSVIHVWKLREVLPGLENMAALKTMAEELER